MYRNEIRYNKSDILKINGFGIKLEDGDNFFKIEKKLTKFLRLNEAYDNSVFLKEKIKWLEREENAFQNLFDYLILLTKKSKWTFINILYIIFFKMLIFGDWAQSPIHMIIHFCKNYNYCYHFFIIKFINISNKINLYFNSRLNYLYKISNI